MPSALSKDLRERIIRAWQHKKLSIEALSRLFEVSTASVKRLKRRVRETGSVQRAPRGGGYPPKVDLEGERYLRQLLKQHGDLTLSELVQRYRAQFAVTLDERTMSNTLQRMGYTRKKRRWCRANASAIQRA